jgi:hypothetical protein
LHRNCHLKQVIEGRIEGKIEVMGRQRRRHKQLLYNLNTLRTGDADLLLYAYKQFKYPVPNVLRKKEDTGIKKRKHKIALCGEFTVAEDM